MIKEIHVVAAAIINDQGQILCCQRGPGRALANLWEFPGGKIEKGEDAPSALIREIKEELHAELTIHSYLGENSHIYDFGRVTMQVYLASLAQDYFQLTEHIQAKWIDKDGLMNLDWAPVDIPFAERLSQK
ncbi:(deoxy)nucleoside triphosphate pyrophosphohydrolase [Vaginisenegalia massiliensis]|uniref:(deoxy)nucleoside triphosphate pyrophosphohydrolase n=1 Tax=Vaginisenegalia massiliensis TaxID=2058294 RepID=UPI000F523830|nr:(deoxy)nucleoside triphosphate pyrophosphohydrolase [Vaginisenegalia massiliensis]